MLNILVIFICMGNTCRSPLAEGYFNNLVDTNGLTEYFYVDSAGTKVRSADSAPSPSSIRLAAQAGIKIKHIRARAVDLQDIKDFDYIIAMDKENLAYLKSIAPEKYHSKMHLLLDYAIDPQLKGQEISDPYCGDEKDYAKSMQLIEIGVTNLFEEICKQHNLFPEPAK